MNKRIITKSLFFFSAGMFLISSVVSLIDMTDLRWSFCYDLSLFNEIDHCRVAPSFFFLSVFLMCITVLFHFGRFDSMNIKKQVLIVSSIASFLFISPAIFYGIFDCYTSNQFLCGDFYRLIAVNLAPFLPVFLLSLITYKLRKDAFDVWFSLSLWFVPILVLVTLSITMNSGGGGGFLSGAMSQAFDALFLGIFYVAFLLVSAVRVILVYFGIK